MSRRDSGYGRPAFPPRKPSWRRSPTPASKTSPADQAYPTRAALCERRWAVRGHAVVHRRPHHRHGARRGYRIAAMCARSAAVWAASCSVHNEKKSWRKRRDMLPGAAGRYPCGAVWVIVLSATLEQAAAVSRVSVRGVVILVREFIAPADGWDDALRLRRLRQLWRDTETSSTRDTSGVKLLVGPHSTEY